MHIVIVKGGRKPVEVRLSFTETILQVKQKLERLWGIPVRRQTLSFDDMELKDSMDLEDLELLHIEENSHIALTVNSDENRFQIIVKLPTTMISLEVEEMDTMASLKDRIQQNIGGPSDQKLILSYQGVEVRDNQRLHKYKLGMHSEIIATFEPLMPPPKRLKFVVETWYLLSIPLEMTAGRTVSDLRKHLVDKDCLPENDYIFIHNQNVMEDNESLLSQGVQDGDSIEVFRGKVS